MGFIEDLRRRKAAEALAAEEEHNLKIARASAESNAFYERAEKRRRDYDLAKEYLDETGIRAKLRELSEVIRGETTSFENGKSTDDPIPPRALIRLVWDGSETYDSYNHQFVTTYKAILVSASPERSLEISGVEAMTFYGEISPATLEVALKSAFNSPGRHENRLANQSQSVDSLGL